ncbi:hypothetical protein HYW54_02645 [Candidatus Gottesmanbacteria bacterium]|nr:hypothetical protein [Candidatus Gottesmanbacteria bacterium]
MPEEIATPTKTTRKKTSTVEKTILGATTLPLKQTNTIVTSFSDLLQKLQDAENEFESLQKEIVSTRELWEKEKKDHEQEIIGRNQDEEIERKREEETFKYEVNRARQKEEDEFKAKKDAWERELAVKKEELAQEKEELLSLRKQVADFPKEKEKAVKDACGELEKNLTHEFVTERKLNNQETNSKQEILALKIVTLTRENTEKTKEIDMLKKALDEATKEVKDIAVRVIEASSSVDKANIQTNQNKQ